MQVLLLVPPTPEKLPYASTPPLTPKTKQWKCILAKKIANSITVITYLPHFDQVEILTLALKQLNILDKVNYVKKPRKQDQTLVSYSQKQSCIN